jgi:hypothetical protein
MPARRHLRLSLLVLCTCCLSVASCDDTTPPGTNDSSDQETESQLGFDDHTLPRIDDLDSFQSLAEYGPSSAAAKFVIARFAQPSHDIRWLDSHFYTMHDEWYWFRLVNGESAPGSSTLPVNGLQFDTLPEIVEWAETQETLPLDLRFVGDGRLYSPEFYTLALKKPRLYGVGSLLRVLPLEQRPEMWVFELEYGDAPDYEELVEFFEVIQSSLSPEIANALRWVVRSPVQESLAQYMESGKLPYWDRIVRYAELAVPGQVEVYNEALKAGRLKAIRSGDGGIENTRSGQILLLEDIPDYLPPASGLISAVPQTPLAHINVLARNRGIPNAYLGGLFDDISLEQMYRVEAPVIVRTIAPDSLDIVAMTESEYRSFLDLDSFSQAAVAPVDPNSIPYTYDLAELDAANVDELRPVIGGKASGFLGLLAVEQLVIPEKPMVITVRAFLEHQESLRPYIDAMLANSSFNSRSEIQFLLLEGQGAFLERYTDPAQRAVAEQFLAANPPSSLLGQLVSYGGLVRMIQQKAIAPETLATLDEALRLQFGELALSQGLRFRSSSSVEDIEGFNGAGLYTSNTGFLDPLASPNPNDQKKSIEWAIKKSWSSYWGFEGFNERRLEKIDHLSGAMALLVHARFDDELELSNGVFTFTLFPDAHELQMEMTLNAQFGAESVTNPTPGLGALPEVSIVRLRRTESTARIERIARSNLSPEGQLLLDDAHLLELFESARLVTEAWLLRENAKLPSEQRASTLTLDFEFREMGPGWPARADGTVLPSRIVIKQARTLEPGLRGMPENVLALPFPRDLLARARRVERISCSADSFSLVSAELYTDPGAFPDFGYQQLPFSAFFSLAIERSVLSLSPGHRVVYNHLSYDAEHPGMQEGGPWSLSLSLSPSAAESAGIDLIELGADGRYLLEYQGEQATGTYSCESTLLRSTPEDYLLALLAAKGL